jgi:hypothetical protein
MVTIIDRATKEYAEMGWRENLGGRVDPPWVHERCVAGPRSAKKHGP